MRNGLTLTVMDVYEAFLTLLSVSKQDPLVLRIGNFTFMIVMEEIGNAGRDGVTVESGMSIMASLLACHTAEEQVALLSSWDGMMVGIVEIVRSGSNGYHCILRSD